jgi:hypothetical protein
VTSRRKFIRNAATGLFVPSLMSCVLRGSVPLPLGFWQTGGVTHQPDVSDWVGRVITNGGSVPTSTQNCADTFALAINAVSGLRAKILRLNLYAGTGFAAAQVPFYKDAGGTVDDPRVGGSAGSGSDWTYVETGSTGGLVASTSGAWLRPGVTLFDFAGDSYNKASIGVYVKTASNENSFSGAQDTPSSSNSAFIVANGSYGDTNVYAFVFSTGAITVSDPASAGFYFTSRTASNLFTLYKNGSSIGTSSSATVTPLSNGTLGIFAYNTLAATGSLPSTKKHLGYVIGKDLDSTQASGLYTALLNFNTCLTRQP